MFSFLIAFFSLIAAALTMGASFAPASCPTQRRKEAAAARALRGASRQMGGRLREAAVGWAAEYDLAGKPIPLAAWLKRGLCAYYCDGATCTFLECHDCGRIMSAFEALSRLGDSAPQCDRCGWERSGGDDSDYGFRDPGGRSALRAETGGYSGFCPSCECKVGLKHGYCSCCGTQLNPRVFPCPSCGARDVLTREDMQRHYCCDRCADRAEWRYVGVDY